MQQPKGGKGVATLSEDNVNYGKLQPNYSLDWVSSAELGLKKLEYKESGMTLDTFYDRDPVNYLLYNIIDVILIKRLNEKLKHIEAHNMLRRLMKTPIGLAMRGPSMLFDTMTQYNLTKRGQYTRYGLVKETEQFISAPQISQIIKPKDNKIKWTIDEIKEDTFRTIVSRYPGAYVKEGLGKVVTLKDGITIDMDGSLPPWEKIFIRRNGFTYWGNIGNYQFQEGDETLTWDKNHNSCWKKVLGKTSHKWKNQLVRIKTETGKTVTVTTNHSIFGIKKGTPSRCVNQIDASNLQIGDYVVGLKQFDTDGKIKSKKPELIGFWLSDGWTQGESSPKYIAKTDKELLEIFDPFISNIRLKRSAGNGYKEEWVGNIQDPVKTELELFYIHTKRKNFQHILNYCKDDRKKIWDGMLFADGTLRGLKRSDVTIPTERLCKYRPEEKDECFIVAHTIGWKPINENNGIANRHRQPDGSIKYGPDQVCPEIFKSIKGACYRLQKNNMSHNCRHTLDKVNQILPQVNQIYTNTVGLEKIISIEYIDYDGDVFDISVEETERFFSGTGIGCHNTALYPSMMLQYNISFDSIFGRVIDPICYQFLALLDKHVGTNVPFPPGLNNRFFEYSKNYVERLAPQNKGEYVQNVYYILCHLINVLQRKNISIRKLMNPEIREHYILLKLYLLPLIDLLTEVHDKAEEYNTFCHDYLLNGKSNIHHIFTIENINEPNIRINRVLVSELDQYLKKNNISMNLSGTLLYTHEFKKGIFTEFLNDILNLRKEYKSKRDSCEPGSDNYKFWDMRQLSAKVVANSTYGLMGQATFRYSDKWIAKTITVNGRLTLKISQICGEIYLQHKKKQ